MEIRPGMGVGSFRFGLTEPELVARLGPPDKRYQTDSEVDRLQYFGPRLEFAIEPMNDNRVGWIEVHDPESTLFGRPVIGEQVPTVLPWLTTEMGEDPVRESIGSLETLFYRRGWMELHIRFGRVECVNLGVPYDESDEPCWPTPDA